LLINPNTTAAMTERMVELAQTMVPLGCTVTGASARFGASYVACRAAYAVAGHAALNAVPVPLIDSLEAGIGAALAIANLPTAKVRAAKFALSPPVETVLSFGWSGQGTPRTLACSRQLAFRTRTRPAHVHSN